MNRRPCSIRLASLTLFLLNKRTHTHTHCNYRFSVKGWSHELTRTNDSLACLSRSGQHRYQVDAQSASLSAAHETSTPWTPSSMHTTSVYESRRKLGGDSSVATSSPHSSRERLNEHEVDEKYEVTVSTYDESGLKILSPNPTAPGMTDRYAPCTADSLNDRCVHCRYELDREMYAACAIVNESLYDANADRKKVVSTTVRSPQWVD